MTTPTDKDIPSNSVQDRLFNAEKFDEFVNSDSLNYADRKGKSRTTLNGIRQSITNWISSLGVGDGAGSIAAQKPYVGTVSRSVTDQLKETISPFDFGIVSDAVFDPTTGKLVGGTDNTSAFQRMLCEAHYHGARIDFPLNGRYATKSLYLHYDAAKNPNWTGRPGRIQLLGGVTGHSTGDVETQGTAIFHIPGETSPLLSMVGEFSLTSPSAMGGYLSLSRLNLIGSANSSDVLLLQGSQGQIELADYTVRVLNPNGNGITESTTWETMHRNGLIRGGASVDNPGVWKGIGLNICSDGTMGQTNMKIYQNVNSYRMGYGIKIGRGTQAQGTFGPLVFMGGQTSLSDEHGMWLEGGVISFASIGQQFEGARKNGIRIDRTLQDGTLSTDLPRTVKFISSYLTGCGTIEDDSENSYAIYVANGDGVELDTTTFNTVGNGIGFNAGEVDNLLIRRPTFRTVRTYGSSKGIGIKAFGTQNATKRIYLEHPVFNQSPLTQIESVASEIFARGRVGGRLSFSNNSATPSISMGGAAGSESYSQINFNNSAPTVITNITGGTQNQKLLITFSNSNTTIQNNKTNIFLNGGDYVGNAAGVIELFYTGSVWREIGDPLKVFSGAGRPVSNLFAGMQFFDLTLNKPIWRNASNTGWVDSTGTSV